MVNSEKFPFIQRVEQVKRLVNSIKEAEGAVEKKKKEEVLWLGRILLQAFWNVFELNSHLEDLKLNDKWRKELVKRVPLKPTFFSTSMRFLRKEMGLRKAFVSEAMAFVAYIFDEHVDNSFDDKVKKGVFFEEVEAARNEFKEGKWSYFYKKMDAIVEAVFEEEEEEAKSKGEGGAYVLLREYVLYLKERGVVKGEAKKILRTLGDVLTGEVMIDMDSSLSGKRPEKLGSFWGNIPKEGDLRIYLAVMNPGVVMVGWQHAVEAEPSLKVEVDEKKLRLAKIASFLVRLSDDWGDREEDAEKMSFNLLSVELGGEFWGWLGGNYQELLNEIKESKSGSEVKGKLLEELRKLAKGVDDIWSKEVIKIAYVAIGVGTEENDTRLQVSK